MSEIESNIENNYIVIKEHQKVRQLNQKDIESNSRDIDRQSFRIQGALVEQFYASDKVENRERYNNIRISGLPKSNDYLRLAENICTRARLYSEW